MTDLIENHILNSYKDDLSSGKHKDNVKDIIDFIKNSYAISEQELNEIKETLDYLQIAYFATDDIIDEGADLEKRVEHVMKLHYGINNFYNKVLRHPRYKHIIENYNKVFQEMLRIPYELKNSIEHLKKIDKGDEESLLNTLAEIQLLRAKHVLFYWVVGLSYVETDDNRVFDISHIKYVERSIELIEKDKEDIEIDSNYNSFNIYLFLSKLYCNESDINNIIEKVKKLLNSKQNSR